MCFSLVKMKHGGIALIVTVTGLLVRTNAEAVRDAGHAMLTPEQELE